MRAVTGPSTGARYPPSVTTRRLTVALATLAVPVLALSLTGCFNGPNATTQMQATMNSGQGVAARVGDILVNNATLVLGPEGSKSATLIMSISDQGSAGDRLTGVDIAGIPADITDGTAKVDGVDVVAQATRPIGYALAGTSYWVNSYGFDKQVSTWVPVRLYFATAGFVDISVLVVPASGIYEGIAPTPVMLQAASAS